MASTMTPSQSGKVAPLRAPSHQPVASKSSRIKQYIKKLLQDIIDVWYHRVAFMSALVVMFSSFQIGYHSAVINAPKRAITECVVDPNSFWQDCVPMNTLEWSWAISFIGIGALVGGTIFPTLSNYISRVWTLLVINVLNIIGVCLQIGIPIYWCFFLGRFFSGLCVGGSAGLVALYLGEISPTKYRGILSLCHGVGLTIALTLAAFFGIFLSYAPFGWRMLIGISGIVSLLQSFAIPLLPYSPRYLMLRGQYRSAWYHLAKLRGVLTLLIVPQPSPHAELDEVPPNDVVHIIQENTSDDFSDNEDQVLDNVAEVMRVQSMDTPQEEEEEEEEEELVATKKDHHLLDSNLRSVTSTVSLKREPSIVITTTNVSEVGDSQRMDQLMLPKMALSASELRRIKEVQSEYAEMVRMISSGKQKADKKEDRVTWRWFFANPRPMLVIFFLMIAQQFIGVNAIFFYSVSIFESSGVSNLALWATLVNFSDFLASVLSALLIHLVPRRFYLIGGQVVSLLGFLIMSISFVFLDRHAIFGVLGVISMFIIVIAFAFSMGPMPYLLAVEYVPNEIRGMAMSFAMLINWTGYVILSATFPLFTEWAQRYTFFPFVVVHVVVIVVSILFAHETKHLSLEAIQHPPPAPVWAWIQRLVGCFSSTKSTKSPSPKKKKPSSSSIPPPSQPESPPSSLVVEEGDASSRLKKALPKQHPQPSQEFLKLF